MTIQKLNAMRTKKQAELEKIKGEQEEIQGALPKLYQSLELPSKKMGSGKRKLGRINWEIKLKIRKRLN